MPATQTPTWSQPHFINHTIRWELSGYQCRAEAEELALGIWRGKMRALLTPFGLGRGVPPPKV
jgi:hypothetical protein